VGCPSWVLHCHIEIPASLHCEGELEVRKISLKGGWESGKSKKELYKQKNEWREVVDRSKRKPRRLVGEINNFPNIECTASEK
jgi:hypothetical protein